MPKYEITSPDGKRFEVTAPDGASQEQVLSYAQQNFGASKPQPPLTEGESIASSAPARFITSAAAPARALLKAIGPESVKQNIEQTDAMRKRGMEKQDTGFDWAGLVGSLMPASRIAKAASSIPKFGNVATGAATAGANPVEGDELSKEKLEQIATGGALGGVIGTAAKAGKAFLGSNKLNPVEAATLKEGQEAGYTVPPSMQNPSGLNMTLESLAGKASVKQDAVARNQKITDALSARALGLPANQPITPGSLQSFRNTQDQIFSQVENLSPAAKVALKELRDNRHQTRLHFDHYFKSADPEALTKAEYHKGLTQLFEQEIENEAKAAGRPELVKALTEARMKIAKSYDVEKALNEADSHVSAPTLGRNFDKKGGKAMTGELATIGKMAEAFRPVMGEADRTPVAGVDGTNAMMSAVLGGMGLSTAGPAGIAAAAAPWVVRPAARNLALSPTYQKYLAQGIPARYVPIIDAMTNQAAGAAGTTAGRNY